MGGFWFSGKKRTATAQKRQVKPTSTALQSETFILERILTPSGLVDGGDDALHPLVTDLHVSSVPDVNPSDTNYWDADLTHATEVSEHQAFLDSSDVEITDKQIFADHSVNVTIPEHELEPLPFIHSSDSTTEHPVADTHTPTTDKSILATNLASENSTSHLDIGGTQVSNVEITDKQIFADHSIDVTLTDSKVEHLPFIHSADTNTEHPVADTQTPVTDKSILATNLASEHSTSTLDISGTEVSNVGVTDHQVLADHVVDATVPDSKVEPLSLSHSSDTNTEHPVADTDSDVTDDNNLATNPPSEQYTFTSGFFKVGSTGKVSIDYLFDGGGYQGQLAIFSLDGMDKFVPGSEEFIHEATSRALSDSNLGHVVINDVTQGARFHGTLPWEPDYNSGEYQGVKTYSMKPGDTFGVMIIPSGTVQQAFNGETWGSLRPLFSMTTANPNDAFHVGQIADVFGNGHTFVMEDLRVDGVSDHDYNDIIFQIRGATGSAVHLDDVIDSNHDWRTTDMGKALIAYAKPYDNPPVDIHPVDVPHNLNTLVSECEPPHHTVEPPVDTSPALTPITDTKGTHFNFVRANQPLIGVIDTGFSANNPDIDYSRIALGHDYVAGDGNPLLQAGEGNEHGTHVLGVIAATQDNGVGIDGINDDAPIWVGRATDSGHWADSLVEFVNYAKESGQPNAVINLSMDLTQINPDGSVTTRYEFTPQERAAIEYARQHDVLIVVAAGNDGGVMSVLGQASQEFDNIITVGSAHDVNPSIAPAEGFDRVDYSSYGYGLDIMADGGTTEQPVLSTLGDSVGTMAGTSVAAAEVTGAASQVWAANPDLSYRQVIELLKITATDLSTPGWDTETGAGLLNIAAAVGLAQVTTAEAYTPDSFSTPTTWGGEGKVKPIERAASEQFNGKYYDWVSYTVKSGDTLSDIAYQTMSNGTAPYYNFIAQHNGLANPNLIYVGQVIQIPKEVSTPPVSTPTPTPAPTPTPTPTPPPTSITINGYTISGSFYPVFQNYRGTLGNPTSGVINYSNGVSYQLFQNGSIVSSQFGTFPLYGGIRKAYLNTGGLDGWLGAPKSGEIGQGNGVIIQYFANGYIIWNGSKATAYKTGSGTPSQPAPNPVPDQSIKLKNFRGWVMPDIGVALRNSPRKDDKSGLADPYGKWLNFDAWTYGDTVNGDSKWFRIAGTNYWVPSAYIYGNPEGLPGNATPDNNHSDQDLMQIINKSPLTLIRTGGQDEYRNFQIALDFVFKAEGGFSNDKNDGGGLTNMGVTQKAYDAYRQRKNLPKQSVNKITKDEATKLYYEDYWLASGSEKLDLAFSIVYFDTVVLCGPSTANLLLKQTDQYLSSLNLEFVTTSLIVNTYLNKRADFHRAVVEKNPTQSKFLKGWLNRVENLRKEVMGVIARYYLIW